MEQQEIEFHFETPVQIRFNDIDSLGHVNNTIIQEYFDLGRMHYFKSVFKPEIDWTTFAAIIASIKTDFVSPVFINNKLLVKTKITKIGNKSMNLVQHITDTDGVIKAISHSVMVGFDHKTQSSIHINDEWREKICDAEKNTVEVKS